MTPAVWAQPAPLLSVPVTVGIMLGGYLLLMGYLTLALRTMRRGPAVPPADRRGWPGLVRKVVGTAVGGYLLLMAVVVGYYQGVARVAGPFLASAFTGCALLAGISVPVFLGASWLEERWRRHRSGRAPER